MVAPSHLSVHWCHGADGTVGVDMCSISWRRRKSLGTPLRRGASVQIPWPPGASMRESFGVRYRKAVVSPWGQGWGTSGEWRAGGWRVGVVCWRDERGWCLQGCNCPVQISKHRPWTAPQHPHFWEREQTPISPSPSSHPAVSLALSRVGSPGSRSQL